MQGAAPLLLRDDPLLLLALHPIEPWSVLVAPHVDGTVFVLVVLLARVPVCLGDYLLGRGGACPGPPPPSLPCVIAAQRATPASVRTELQHRLRLTGAAQLVLRLGVSSGIPPTRRRAATDVTFHDDRPDRTDGT